jgi:hypothetical protein
MAVGTPTAVSATSKANGSATTLTVTLTSSVAAGDFCVIAGTAYANTFSITGVSDNGPGNTWTVDNDDDSSVFPTGWIVRDDGTGIASGTVITITFSVSVDGRAARAFSVSGMDSGSPVVEAATTQTSGTASWTSTSHTVATDNGLLTVAYTDSGVSGSTPSAGSEILDDSDFYGNGFVVQFRVGTGASINNAAAWGSGAGGIGIASVVYAASGGSGATVTAVPADGTGDIANPALAAGSVVASPVLDGTGDIAAPTVSGNASATVVAVPLDATGDVANPAVGTGAIVVAPTLDATGDVATAGMPMSAALDAPTLDAAGDVANPAVSASGTETVVAVPLDAAGDVANPALVAGAVVVAVTGDATGDVANPTVTGGSPPAGGAGARQLLGVGS